MTELKRCPLCNSDNVKLDDFDLDLGPDIKEVRHRVICLDCCISLHRSTMLEAVRDWNTRKYTTLVADISVPKMSEDEFDEMLVKSFVRFARKGGIEV